ncbi:MAG: 30S ribosomal protein S16 [Candidatus Colwellbacteria bacterium CG10_big_fil_rev_8_21_14_0_10_42_22]|uniref:Small ribosomal subunit protein bS16 n=1 Tax=Candidatus Colwellbacteria bacterium CG10_big_fil_rev_8_21_14_0_10_42_22 TaxID=1974540 RepID=A0A2H0VF54_9BACT|nr:MAG: 30S ribosomal protein S16 [Candidatus Colwellbacteria bacterium CG10_big_fil_rev_8_21_14_0_10_42_22]
MLAVKLKLIGKKGQHSFRVIVQEKKAKLNGKFVDDLGWYNPHSNQVKIDQEKLKKWLGDGARPTESAEKIIKKAKESSEIQDYENRKNPKKKKKEKLRAEAPTPAPTETQEQGEAEKTPPTEPQKADDVSSGDEVVEQEKPKED